MPFGPQHDFRKSPDERKDEALEYMRAEFPDAHITIAPRTSGMYCLTIEECDHSEERIRNVAKGLDKIVEKRLVVITFEHGADILLHA
jgi:hypothetical protein